MSKYAVYGIGAALVDMELEVSDEFLQQQGVEKGLMTLVEPERQEALLQAIDSKQIVCKQASGGSAANTLYATSCFGAKTYYSCKTNNDEKGRFFVEDMKRAGVDCSPSLDNQTLPTGTCLVMVTPDAERTMNTYLAISETFSESELEPSAIEDAHYLYIEGYLCTSDTGRAAAVKAKALAEQAGIKTAITLSDPAMVNFFKPQLKEMVGSGVDLLFCNEEEALAWTESDSIEQAVEALKSDAKQFAVTLGAKGAVVYDGQTLIQVSGDAVEAKDSNGAGDMFAGAFLYAINAGQNFEQAGTLACKAAGKVVSQFGPRLAVSAHAELL